MNNLGLITKKLLGSIKMCLSDKVDANIMNGKIVLPYWKISIDVVVTKADKKSLSGQFILSSNEWDRQVMDDFYIKAETISEMIENATTDFVYGLLSSIVEYENGSILSNETTEYAGDFHVWDVYCGNILVTGQTPRISKQQDEYWNDIKKGVFKRIGNQKICDVSIYAEYTKKGEVIGECLINNVYIKELSDIIESKVKKWKINGFGSIKQHVLIMQDNDTYRNYTYDQYMISEYVKDAMVLFEKYNKEWIRGKHDPNWFDNYLDELFDIIRDDDLVWEISSFIPEICTYAAFDDIDYYDGIVLCTENEEIQMYETQLASYTYIKNAVFDVLNSGVLKNTDETYGAYVGISSTMKALSDMLKKGCKYKDISFVGPILFAPDGYAIR